MKKFVKTISIVTVIFLALIISYHALVWLGAHYHWAVRKLPKSASQIKVFNSDTPGDILYVVRAKMSEAAFAEYVQNLGFEFLEDPAMQEKAQWFTQMYSNKLNKYLEWWDPSSCTEYTYYDPEHATSSYSRILKYENGYAYYQESTFWSWY